MCATGNGEGEFDLREVGGWTCWDLEISWTWPEVRQGEVRERLSPDFPAEVTLVLDGDTAS